MQRATDRCGHRHGVQPDLGVALEHRPAGRVDVPAADVAWVTVGVDDGEDAVVGQRGDDDPGQPCGRRLDVEGAGELGADLGEQGEPPSGPLGLLLRLPALGHLDEEHRQPVGSGPGPQLVPAVQRLGVVRVEGDRLPGRHRPPVALLEDPVHRGREGIPDDLSEQLIAGAPEQLLRLGVDVGEPPLPVQRVEAGRHRLEHPGHPGLARHLGGDVVGHADHPGGRACGGPEAPAPGADPAGVAAGQQDPVVHVQLALGGDHVLERLGDPGQVVGVQPDVERLDGLLEGGGVVAEHLDQPGVPAEPSGRQVPVEGADARGLDRQLGTDPGRLQVARRDAADRRRLHSCHLLTHQPRQVPGFRTARCSNLDVELCHGPEPRASSSTQITHRVPPVVPVRSARGRRRSWVSDRRAPARPAGGPGWARWG